MRVYTVVVAIGAATAIFGVCPARAQGNTPTNPCEGLYVGAPVPGPAGCNVAHQRMVCVETAKGVLVPEPTADKCEYQVQKTSPKTQTEANTKAAPAQTEAARTRFAKKAKAHAAAAVIKAQSGNPALQRCSMRHT